MLSNERIIKALDEKEIDISISFYYKNEIFTECESELDFLSSPLKDNLYSDRLKLTMGPLIKGISKTSVKNESRFRSTSNCFDLRKSNNKYTLNPGESIVVLTNEKIKLNGKYACLIVPRISLSDVGIVVTTAYVDPFYNGVLRLHLSNLSNKPYELNVVEAIAQCFFFELSDPVAETFKEQFSTKSVFYGQTWRGILDSDRDPFPTKKKSSSIDKFSNIKNQFKVIWNFIKKHSLILVLLANLAVIIGGYEIIKQNYTRYTNTVEQVESFLNPMDSEIIISPGEYYGEKEIIVNYAKSDIVSILCNNNDVQYKLLSGNTENETRIIFSLMVSSAPTDEYEVNFTYVIIRRIDR